MPRKSVILVTGASGAESFSVAKALLQKKKYEVRVLVNDANSDRAIALEQCGAELIEADPANTPALEYALHGTYGVYVTTRHTDTADEQFRTGRIVADAAKLANVQHLVLSTQKNYYAISGGKFSVPRFDRKASLQQYAKALGVPSTFVHIAFHYENLFSCLKMTEEGSFFFGSPQGTTRMAMVSVEDVGGVVAKVFDHPAEYINRTVGVVGADDTCNEYAALMTRILGRYIRYSYIPRDVYALLGFSDAEELANMFEVQRLHIPNREIDLIETYGLNPATQSFKSWLMRNRNRFEAQFRSLMVSVRQPV